MSDQTRRPALPAGGNGRAPAVVTTHVALAGGNAT